MGALTVGGLTKVYPDGTVALRELSLDADDGELLALVGPSGCGKSTLLRIIAGLDVATAGSVSIAGRAVDGLPPGRRNVGMVFQGAANFPHMSVRENLAFGLRVRREPRNEVRTRTDEVARILGLTDLLARRPAELSGGERQRVAIGRAMLRRPDVFLMDEPLSSLDAQLRLEMRREIWRLQRQLSTTTLIVTHDQTEAMAMGDRVAVVRDGAVEQVDRPEDLYDRPRTVFVAGFIGAPAMNLVPALIDGSGARVGGTVLVAPPGSRPGSAVTAGIRPGDLSFAPPSTSGLELEVDRIEYLGADLQITCRLVGTGHLVAVTARRGEAPAVGDIVSAVADPHAVHWFGPDGVALP